MNCISESFAREFANGWVSAWNAHDLARVLEHYDDDLIFRSPMITVITGIPMGELQGKDAVRSYWSQALARLPDLKFELLDVLIGSGCLTLYYRGHRGLVAETFHFGKNNKVINAAATYSIGL